MARNRLRYRDGWSSDFSFEPIDVYKEKERERARDLLRQRTSGMPVIPAAGKTSKGFFGQMFAPAREAVEALPELPQAKPKKKGGGGIFGGLKDIAGDVGGVAAKAGGKALDVLGASQEYGGKPIFGTISGLSRSEQYTDPETGRTYRKSASFKDVGQSLASAVTQDPRKTYREGRQASTEYLADPNKGAGHKFAAGLVMDPLSYVGVGVLKKAGLAGGGRLGSVLASAIESPRRATAGAIIGGSVASEAAERAGLGQKGQTAAGLGGALLGGGVTGSRAARRGAGAARRELTTGRLAGETGGGELPGKRTSRITAEARAARAAPAPPPEVAAAEVPTAIPAPRARITAQARAARTAAPSPPQATAAAPEAEALVDYLRGKAQPDAVAAAGERSRAGQGLDAINERLRGKLRNNDVEAVRQEYERTQQVVRELAGVQVDRIQGMARKAGLKVVPEGDGWVLEGTGVPIEDIVEQSTDAGRAAYANLSPEQRAVFDEVARVNDEWNQTIRSHGATVPMRDIEGTYWPRRVVGVQVEAGVQPAANAGGAPGRKVGAARIGPRSKESVAQGIEEGIVYDEPFAALRAGLGKKARIAQDAYVKELVAPLELKDADGLVSSAVPGGHPAFSRKTMVPGAEGEPGTLVDVPMRFQPETARGLGEIFNTPGFGQTKLGKGLTAVNREFTPVRAMADASYLFNQGMGFLESSPVNAAKGARASFKVVKSAMGDPGAYDELIRTEAARGPGLDFFSQRGLHYVADIDSAADDFLAGPLSRKLPVVGKVMDWSSETFARYTNYARLTLANDAYERLAKQGLDPAALDKELEGAIKSINRMTGWTSKSLGDASAAFFAPRFFRSNLEQLARAVTPGGGMEGHVARQHLGRLIAFGAVSTVALNEARGYDTELDPRSHNFLRIRNVGGSDISPFGPYSTLIRGLATTFAGDDRGGIAPDLTAIPDFVRAKSSPVVSTLWSLGSGRSFEGTSLEANPLKKEFLTETIPAIAKESVPFSVQNAIETRDPLSAGLSALGAQSSLVTPAEKRDFARDKVAKEKFGQGYADLLGEQKAAVNRDERVAGHQKEVEKRGLEREDKFVQASTAYRAKIEAAGRYLTFGKDDVGKPYSGDDYREAYSDAAKEFAGAQSVLDERSGDKILDGWFALYDDAALADGSTDYKKLERLQVQYEAAHPEVVEKIAKLTGTRDDEVAAAYRKARKLANEFYDIPAYRGLSVEESEAASGAMAMASGLVSNGAARSRNHAYILLMEQGLLDEDAVLSAKLAVRAGSNPERKAFRAANPAFGRFYSATPLFDQFETGYVGGSTERPSGGTIRRGSRILEGRTRNRLRG